MSTQPKKDSTLNTQMDDFLTFFERFNRNPLRKKQLADGGVLDNREWIDIKAKTLSPKEKIEVKNLSRRKNTSKEHVDEFKKNIENKKRTKLSKGLIRGKFYDNLRFIQKHKGVKIYIDQYFRNKLAPSLMVKTINQLFDNYGDIIPRRGFDIIITNAETNPEFATMRNIGDLNVKSDGYYHDRRIFMDDTTETIKNVEILLHEYSHFLAGRIPKETNLILRKEYNRMLNSYFKDETGKRTGRKNLEGAKNASHRIQFARKMGLPDELSYASTNFDEWFAVLMQHWKNLPNDKHTYRLKNLLKKVLIRV